MALDQNLYDGIFYCVKCDTPIHCFKVILQNEKCGCGSKSFISHIDYKVSEILGFVDTMVEDMEIRL